MTGRGYAGPGPYTIEDFEPLRCVLCVEPDGSLTGLAERSVAMDWSKTDIRIWWSGTAFSILGEHLIDGNEDANYQARYYREKGREVVVFDPQEPGAPVEVDLERWIACMNNPKAYKGNKRNAPMKPRRDHG